MDKIYVGNAKTVTTQFGDILKVSMSADDLTTLQENLSNGWVNFDILKRKAPSEKGMTHYAVLNTWKPESQANEEAPAPQTQKPTKKTAPKKDEEMDVEDLPF